MKQILVVDDAATMRMFYRSILEPAGYQVVEAWNGIEALEKALVNPPDLYLVDVNMPGQDGFSFLHDLRQQPIPQAPAIIISTEPTTSSRALAYQSGANAYLAKPAPPDQVLRYIKLMIGEATQ